MLTAGTIVGEKYEILRPLESGGMGDVYEAVQKDLARPVAIKLLRAELSDEPSLFLRFRREAETAASLGHPNIVQILEYRNEPGEEPMLVMEKLEGRSLRHLLEAEGTLAPPRAVFIAIQILSALAAAHKAKIIHRDVKPGNVFILKTLAVPDFVKVLDFGIAKVSVEGAVPITDLGQILGTASYMAPEQAKGIMIDGRADLFAVGGILFQAITGKRPREIGTAGLIDVGRMPCARVLDVAPHIDPRLAAVIDRALSLDRDHRDPDAETMAAALEPFASGRPSAPAPPPVRLSRPSAPLPMRAPSRWSPWMYAPPVLVAGFAAVIVVAVLALGYRRNAEEAELLGGPPVHCRPPATCTQLVKVGSKERAYCTGQSAPRSGDVVFVERSGTAHAVVFVARASDGTARVSDSRGGAAKSVASSTVLGSYCAP